MRDIREALAWRSSLKIKEIFSMRFSKSLAYPQLRLYYGHHSHVPLQVLV